MASACLAICLTMKQIAKHVQHSQIAGITR